LHAALGHLGEALEPLARRAGQVVLPLVDGELRFPHPFGGLVGLLRLLLLEQVMVGHRDRDLRLHLQKLVLHVENHLLDHLLRVFSPVDQVVQVRANQRCDAFEYCHRSPHFTPAVPDGSSSFRTFDSKSPSGMPDSASLSAGTCAAICGMSFVILCIPVEPLLPVETTVILSTLLSRDASA